MTDATGYSSRILQLLGDPSCIRFTQAQVTEALRLVLKDFSQSNPVIISTVLNITAPGKEINLGTLPKILYPVNFVYPYNPDFDQDDVVSKSDLAFRFYLAGGVPFIRVESDQVPAAGASAKLIYAAAHTIQGIDSETETSIMPVHDSFIVIGAAAYTLDQRSAVLAEAYGQRSIDVTRIQTLAADYHSRWEGYLSGLKLYASSIFPHGFALDKWDDQHKRSSF